VTIVTDDDLDVLRKVQLQPSNCALSVPTNHCLASGVNENVAAADHCTLYSHPMRANLEAKKQAQQVDEERVKFIVNKNKRIL
jgi:hypothetical protein